MRLVETDDEIIDAIVINFQRCVHYRLISLWYIYYRDSYPRVIRTTRESEQSALCNCIELY